MRINFFIDSLNNIQGLMEMELGEDFKCLDNSSPFRSFLVVIFFDVKSDQQFVILDEIILVAKDIKNSECFIV